MQRSTAIAAAQHRAHLVQGHDQPLQGLRDVEQRSGAGGPHPRGKAVEQHGQLSLLQGVWEG